MMRRWKALLLLLAAIGSAFLILYYTNMNQDENDDLFLYQASNEQLVVRLQKKLLPDMSVLVNPEKFPIMDELKRKYSRKANLNKLETSKTSQLSRFKFFNNNSDDWRELTRKIFVYSAYLDQAKSMNGTVIRIVAIGPRNGLNDLKVRCLLNYNDTLDYSDDVYSGFTFLPEQHNSKFLSIYFFCFSRNPRAPSKVALHEEGASQNLKWLILHKEQRENYTRNNIAVCVRPMYGSMNNVRLLAEFIAFYDAIDVSSFTFYDYNVSTAVKDYLQELIKAEMRIRLLSWKLPTDVANSTWQNGQLASIQDCILRNSQESNLVLLVDLDEFLVPRKHFTLTELMDDLSSSTKRKIGSYIFRQSYFCRNESSVSKEDFPLMITERKMRETEIWPPKKRSKVIVRPEAVIEAGIHFVWKHTKGWKEAVVPWELAMIHHYNDEGCKKTNASFIEDDTAENFKYEVKYSKPVSVWKEIMGL